MQSGSVTSEEKVPAGITGRRFDGTVLEARIQHTVNKIVGESVLSGLSHFGNKNVVDSLLYILELEHSVNIYNVAFNLSILRSGINAMFGSGGYVLEEHVCEEVATRLGIERNGRNLEVLIDLLVKAARQKLE